MSKRIISVILTLMLLASTAVVATVSVAAAEGESQYYTPKTYVPSEDAVKAGQNRYFFVLPDEWVNDYTNEAGVYWWAGTDACGSLDGAQAGVKWPGYKIWQFTTNKVNVYQDNDPSKDVLYQGTVWYVDVPIDVATIIFTNALDGGDESWPDFDEKRYVAAAQTVDVGSEYYDAGENDNYPDGTESFNNMIYIIDPSQTSTSVTGKSTYGGAWYYYHGNATSGYEKWDTQLNPTYGGAEGEAPGEPEVPQPTAGPTEPTTAEATDKPAPATNPTSNVSTADSPEPTNVTSGGTVATNDSSSAIIVLVALLAATGVMIAIKKKEMF